MQIKNKMIFLGIFFILIGGMMYGIDVGERRILFVYIAPLIIILGMYIVLRVVHSLEERLKKYEPPSQE